MSKASAFPPLQWQDQPFHTLTPGFRARFIHSTSMTFAFVEADKDAVIPEHAHPHEQVTSVLDGTLELTVGGTTHRLKAGDVKVIPSNMTHAAKAITHCRILDVFHPVREDYAAGDFSTVAAAS